MKSECLIVKAHIFINLLKPWFVLFAHFHSFILLFVPHLSAPMLGVPRQLTIGSRQARDFQVGFGSTLVKEQHETLSLDQFLNLGSDLVQFLATKYYNISSIENGARVYLPST